MEAHVDAESAGRTSEPPGTVTIVLARLTVVLSIVLLTIVGAAVVAVVAATAVRAPALVELPVAVLALVIVYGTRWTRVAVFATEDALRIRNPLVTRTVPRSLVTKFVIGGSRWSFPSRAVRAVLMDRSTIVLMATDGRLMPKGRTESALEQLEGWRLRAR